MMISLLMLLAIVPVAQAADECNGFINISYPGSPPLSSVGDVLTMRIDLGTGTITGGPANTLIISAFGLDLSCVDPPGPLPNCVSEGPVAAYVGDASIVENCPGVIVSDNPGGTVGHVKFTITPPLVIPANIPIPPDFCNVQIGIKVLAPSSNPNGVIEEVIGYDVAACDNGVLLSGGFQTGSIPVEQLGNFDCYQVPRGRFSPTQTVPVVNQFADLTVSVNTLHRLCAPSTINGDPAGVNFDGIHLAAYDIKSVTGTINKQKVTIATPIGTRTGTIGQLTSIAIPTSKSFAGPPPLPPLGIVPPYACFRLTNTKGDAAQDLTVEDQFATTVLDIDKRGPFSLCVASQVDGIPPDGLPTALLCNRTIEDTSFGTKFPFITNIFQSTQVTISQFDELCVPAVIQ